MATRRRRPAPISAGEIFIWLLFFALLAPAGFAGWAIGHYTAGGTKTVTRSAAAPPSTASATATTAAATTAPATTAAAASTAAGATATAAGTTTAAAAAGTAAKGKAMFASSGCGACHTYAPAGASAKVGPDLDTKPQADAKKAGMPLAAFIRESIVKPNAYISPGYPKGVMPGNFGTTLSKAQLADLVAFLTSGSK